MAIKKARARTGGSGFTIFQWGWPGAIGSGDQANVQALMFARQVTDQSPAPVGPGTVPIHPMDSLHPDHLITPGAIGMGTLTIEVYELIDRNAWENFAGLQGLTDLAYIFNAVAALETELTIKKLIYNPGDRKIDPKTGNFPAGTNSVRSRVYHNCVISNLIDGESVEVGTMEILKQIVLNYTHVTNGDGGGG